jgi:hypothetical protein
VTKHEDDGNTATCISQAGRAPATVLTSALFMMQLQQMLNGFAIGNFEFFNVKFKV